MNIMKKNLTGWVAVLALVSAFGVVPANAEKRNVIFDAEEICAEIDAETHANPDQTIVDACALLLATGETTITGRNDVKNQVALLRNISSAILALDDWLVRGKEQQVETAIGYLCSYADKVERLAAAGKLDADTAFILIEAGEAIVTDLGGLCD